MEVPTPCGYSAGPAQHHGQHRHDRPDPERPEYRSRTLLTATSCARSSTASITAAASLRAEATKSVNSPIRRISSTLCSWRRC